MAIAGALALAGCGGSSDSSTSTGTSQASSGGGETTPAAGEGSGKSAEGKGRSSSGKSEGSGGLSKAEFVKQANTICEEGKKQSLEKMSAYVKAHKNGPGKANFEAIKAAIQAVIVPAIQTQAEEIRALSVSGGDEAKVDAFATALEEGVKNAEEAKGSANGPYAQSFKRSAELAREYGLDGCAYG